MKRFILALFVLVFLPLSNVLATDNEYMMRRSDSFTSQEIDSIAQLTQEAQEKKNTEITSEETQTPKKIEPQKITIYGWFDPKDENNSRSTYTKLRQGESRAVIGEPNSTRELETFKIFSSTPGLAIKYASRLDGQDWSEEATGVYDLAQSTGNTGVESVKMNNLWLALTGPSSLDYDIYYRVYATGTGWLSWSHHKEPAVKDDAPVHIEALEVRILPKGAEAPPETVDVSTAPLITGQSYMQQTEWQNAVRGKDVILGEVAAKRPMQSFSIGSSDPDLKIAYQALIQDIGWSETTIDNTPVGAPQEDKYLEAVKFWLDGSKKDQFDIYYRSYCQDYGWLDWANNSQLSGTTNQGLRIEALQVKLVPKGAAAPGNTDLPAIEANDINEGKILESINMNRLKKGLKPLTSDAKLHEAAQQRSNEIAIKYSHLRPNEQGYDTILKDIGYRSDQLTPALGEITLKITDPTQAFMIWYNDAAALRLLETSYYQYAAFYATPNMSDGTTGNCVLLFSDAPSKTE